jgi:hypothetical protein
MLNSAECDGTAVRQRLLKHANRRLGFYVGERYQQAVVRCLNSDLGEEGGDESVDVQLGFMHNVVDMLQSPGV